MTQPTDKPILYLGDTSLSNAAGYLAGLMSFFRLGYDYVPSSVAVNGEAERPRALYVISDYSAKQMTDPIQRDVVRRVERGAGLLMIGGWESYHGLGGDWDGTPIGQILPVRISRDDDRVNCDQPALVRKVQSHPIVDDLPWDERPPTIGGFNRFAAKSDGQVLLDVQRFAARRATGTDEMHFRATGRDPLLVVGRHGRGRVAALATDVAPHWSGGMVDWGDGPRVTAAAPESWEIEVGSCYAKFVRQLLAWTGQLEAGSAPTRADTVLAAHG
jgi:hypothetical protein